MNKSPQQLGETVVARCRELGFAAAGICKPGPIDHAQELLAWLAAGKNGSMAWFAENIRHRLDPSGLLNGCMSMIVVADLYARRGDDPQTLPPDAGRIARYAQGRDYHRTIKQRLKKLTRGLDREWPGHRFRPMVDVMPIHEREVAARAGIGWVGKHTLIIHPRLGSWFMLGCVLTTMDLAPPTPSPEPDHCGTCTRCIDACPTGAITPYSVDASRCISYLTIERREAVPPEFHAAMGDWLYGCDICQGVCPHNSPSSRETESQVHPSYTAAHGALDLLQVLGWSEQEFEARFLGTAVRRVTLAMLKRNAIIVAGNLLAKMPESQAGPLAARLREIAGNADEAPLVRVTAIDVSRRLDEG